MPRRGRSKEPWIEIFRGSRGVLFIQQPTDAWIGRDWTSLSLPGERVWLWGDPKAVRSAGASVELGREADPSRFGVGFQLLRVGDDGFRVTTDRFGTVHAYRGPRGWSSCFEALEPRRDTLDIEGLAGFFACGFFPGRRTFDPDISILEPASHHDLTERGHCRRRYWNWCHEPSSRPYERVLDDFIDLFRQVIAELDVGRVAIPISGGLDSRLVLAALTGHREGRWGFSYGYGPRSIETRIAQELAAKRGLSFESYSVPSYLWQRQGDVLRAVEGFQDVTQSRQVFMSKKLRAQADTVIAAHWGDVWLDDMGWAGAGTRDPAQHVLNRILKGGRSWLLDHMLAEHRPQPEQGLQGWVEQELGSYRNIEDVDFRIKAFKTDAWSFRWTLASLRAYELGARPSLPFYDPRLVDFFLTVPTEHVAGRRLEIDAIKRLAPDLARVRWQAFDASLYSWHRHDTLHLPRRAVKKAWRLLRRQKVLQRNWEVQFGGEDGRQGLRRRLLEPGLRLHQWVDRQEVDALLADFEARPTGAVGYTVSMLVTLSLWLEAS